MSFILNLTVREIRSSWRRLLFFFICISIGVGSIVALRSLIQNLNRAVAGEARNLMTADLEISSNNKFSAAELQAIERVTSNSNLIEARDETIQTNIMARPSNAANQGLIMLELKGIDSDFPLVGDFRLSDGKPFEYSFLQNNGAVAAPLLLERLGLKIGDSIRIGTLDFQIRGTFDTEPGDSVGFKLGPRVFIERKAFDEAGLTGFGTRNRRKILFRTPDNPENLLRELRRELKQINSIALVRSYKESQEDITNGFERAENFLSLTGLVVLVLGGIGIWNVTRVFIEQKKKTIAILKCLGGSGRQVISSYLLQVLSLGLFGSIFGVLLAQLAMWIVERNFSDALPANLSYKLQFSAVWQGILLGLLVSALFSALPLLQIRNIKPKLLLRDDVLENLPNLQTTFWQKIQFWKNGDSLSFLLSGLVCLGLLLVAVWQAGSWLIGIYFLLGLSVTAALLYFIAALLIRFLGIFRRSKSFALRHSIHSLSRPGNQTRVVLLAVGLGVFVVLAVQSLQANLLREFDLTRGNSLPSLFLIDIRPAQGDGIRQIIEQKTAEKIEFIPTVRGRIAAIDGKTPDFENREVRVQRGQIGREYVLTYRPNLIGNERIIAGKFWDVTPSSEPEVSVDEDLRGLMGLDVGSTMTFDIYGQRLDAKVTSIREMDVRNPRSTFLILFRPGVLEDAPQTLICPVMTQFDAQTRAVLQRQIVDKYPNVSAIDTTDAITSVKKVLSNLTLAVSFIGLFVFFSGVLILLGSVALTKFQRIYENAVLKTLGAKRGLLTAILLTEYGILGLIAGVVGTLTALGLSYTVSRFVLKINWQFDFGLMTTGILFTVLLVMIIGAAASLDVLLRKPLQTLRSQ
jgi:putative ABC transport system permease protein